MRRLYALAMLFSLPLLALCGCLKEDELGSVCLAVTKQPTMLAHITYPNEKYWLERLAKSGAIAEALAFFDDKQTIILEHVGEPLTLETLPEDWERQLSGILRTLRVHNCRHNDLKPCEILVSADGRLRMVDFGMASALDEPLLPSSWGNSDWLLYLGEGYKCPSGFDDRCALRRVMQTIRKGIMFPERTMNSSFPCLSMAGASFNFTGFGETKLLVSLQAISSWEDLRESLGPLIGAACLSSMRGSLECEIVMWVQLQKWVEESCQDGESKFTDEGTSAMEIGRSGWVKYSDPKRGFIGSQSEEPWWEVQQDDSVIMVDGYHKYTVSRALNGGGLGTLQIMKSADKFGQINEVLFDLNVKLRARSGREYDSTRFMDVGCSGGIVSLLAHHCGFHRVLALDHDAGYVDLVENVVERLRLRSVITPLVFQFGQSLRGRMQYPSAVNRGSQARVSDAFPGRAPADSAFVEVLTADVVYCGAIIHWVFSATADFGNFGDIFDYLFSLSSALVVVEWVAPEDPAMSILGHTSINSNVHREAYSTENFEAAIVQCGGVVLETRVIDGPTRILYVIEKPVTAGLCAASASER
jgi:serine/threonine protein kinase